MVSLSVVIHAQGGVPIIFVLVQYAKRIEMDAMNIVMNLSFISFHNVKNDIVLLMDLD